MAIETKKWPTVYGDIYSAARYVQDEEISQRRGECSYLFNSINENHARAVKVYDAEKGNLLNQRTAPKATATVAKKAAARKEDQEDYEFWSGFAIGMAVMSIIVVAAVQIAAWI